jgi:hypothetical protein
MKRSNCSSSFAPSSAIFFPHHLEHGDNTADGIDGIPFCGNN